MTRKFDHGDIGCYVASWQGHEAVRAELARLVEELGHTNLAFDLRHEMSDDACEEDDAIVLLNEHCAPGVSFGMIDGELMLLSDAMWERALT